VTGIPQTTSASASDQLTNALQGKQSLLVLDNCEHVVESCAQLVERLVRACPDVAVLTTSREPLGTASESVWRVPSLTVPRDGDPSLSEMAMADAVRLFVAWRRVGEPESPAPLIPDDAVARL
jgi:predicted ATPase